MLQYNGQCYRYSTTYIVRMVVSGAGVVEGTHTIQNTNSKMSLKLKMYFFIVQNHI
jgi:hypothetical protein